MTQLTLPYAPIKCGAISGQSKATLYGCAYDWDMMLVALSVQAPATTAEQIHYLLQGQENQITINETGAHFRYLSPRKSKFKVIKTPIHDTSEVSLIMLNMSLFKPPKESAFTHVWYHDEDQFKLEVFHRVSQIVYIPVKREWAGYLTMYGAATEVYGKPMAGRLRHLGPENPDEKNWQSAGFDIGYIRNYREPWESLISQGLKKGLIEI